MSALADSTKQGTKEGYGVESAYADPNHGSGGMWRRCVGRAANRICESNSTFSGGALDDLESAQQSLARKVDLNPLQRSDPGAIADLRPGDSRALHEAPHQIRVAAEPDVVSGILFGTTGVLRTDPTGLIACPQPCNVRYAAASSKYDLRITRYAQTWEFEGDNFAIILEYEF